MSARFSWLDIKLGIRMLFKHPALTVVGGLGMAVGIAISVGFFSFMMATAYPEIPLDEGERIIALENRDVRSDTEDRQALHDFHTWRAELKSIEDVGAFRTVERNLITGGDTPELANVAEMTAAGFRVARVQPLLGRHLQDEDEQATASPVVVIGYDLWQTRFAGERAVIGRQVRIGGELHTVVGVMPQGFRWPENHQLWTPFRSNPLAYARGAGPEIYIFGRLAPEVTLRQAQVELTTLGKRAAAAFPESNAQLEPMVMPYVHSLSATHIQGITLWKLSRMTMMTSLLLLVVALNVAVLVYARTATRQGEIAVRSALGASRMRVIGQLFAEALVLALIAAGAGLLIAQLGMALGKRIMETALENGTPFWMDYSIRTDTIVVTIALAVVAALIVGVLPGLQATGKRLQSDLRQLSGGTNARLGKTWTALIVAQVAIAVAALPVAVNMGWNQIRNAATRPTFPAHEFVTATLTAEGRLVATATAPDAAPDTSVVRFADRLTELMRRLDADATVAGVSYRVFLPGGTMRIENRPTPEGSRAGDAVQASGIDRNFFQTFGLRMIAGRALQPADFTGVVTTVVVNQTFVQRVLSGENAVGLRIRHVSEEERTTGVTTTPVRWYEIVGVVADMYRNPVASEQVTPEAFYPLAPDRLDWAMLAVRLRPGRTASDFAPTLRQIAANVDPALRLGTVRSLADADRQEQTAARLGGLAVALVLISVLLLSAAGIYALMSFTVTQRRREIGIRSALGARPRQVLASVFARAAMQITAGVALGVIAAALLERVTNGGLVQGRAFVLLPALAIAMAVVGLLAALGPVRRGLRIAPTEALRSE